MSLNIISPFLMLIRKKKILFIVVKNLTKWFKVIFVTKIDATMTIKFLMNQIIFKHSCPVNILINNKTNFTLKYCKGVKII